MPWSWTSLGRTRCGMPWRRIWPPTAALDCLVNCAGIIHMAPLAEITEADWDRTIDVDLKGTFLCSQAAAPHLTASGRGRIVNIGSDASHLGFPMIPPLLRRQARRDRTHQGAGRRVGARPGSR